MFRSPFIGLVLFLQYIKGLWVSLKCISIVAPSSCMAVKSFDQQGRAVAGLITSEVALYGYLCIHYNQFAIPVGAWQD